MSATASRTAKVAERVTFTILVNVAEYDAEYGTRESINDIKAYVAAVARDAVVAAFAHIAHAVEVK